MGQVCGAVEDARQGNWKAAGETAVGASTGLNDAVHAVPNSPDASSSNSYRGWGSPSSSDPSSPPPSPPYRDDWSPPPPPPSPPWDSGGGYSGGGGGYPGGGGGYSGDGGDGWRRGDTVYQPDTVALAAELEALQGLYSTSGGAHWRESYRWLSTQSPCRWYGISCDNGTVAMISLPANNITGTFPGTDFWSKLPNLKSLSLRGNHLTGSIGPLPANLTRLSLPFNQLEGSLAAVCSLTKLRALNLDGNHFSELPSCMSSLKRS